MPVQPTYPGVYVQEVPSDVHTITGVSTSIALFVGRAAWGQVNQPVLCLNYSDFERNFTSDTTFGDMPRQVKLFFLNGGTQCYIMRIAKNALPAENLLTASITATAKQPGKLIGDTLFFVVTAGSAASTFHLRAYRLLNGQQTDVQEWDNVSMKSTDPRFVTTYVNCKWIDFKPTTPGDLTLPTFTANSDPNDPGYLPYSLSLNSSDGITPDVDTYTAAYATAKTIDLFNLLILPQNMDTTVTPAVAVVRDKALWGPASSFCDERRAFLLIDPPDTWTNDMNTIPAPLNDLHMGLTNDHSAIYFPNIQTTESSGSITTGPAGAMAGLMSRIDSSRGVWKAPAGTEADIRGITGIQYILTDGDSGVLNPLGVNVIRLFPNGIVSWGARTMDGNNDFASQWKYIPVRRTALFIEESLYRGLKWVVFEPNDERLWGQIRLNVGAFMHNLFVQGAFQGLKKNDAYFVKCDAETTTQNDIDLGIVNVWVGFAPLKPAEFVILYLQQMTGQIQI